MSLSAAVTRILTLSGFPPELKTRDIQAAFSEYENDRGGFKIKWVDDTSLMLVFTDAGTAKRAYLSTLYQPPATLVAGPIGRKMTIKPYDGPEAQSIIQNVNARTGHRHGGGHGVRQSISANGPIGGGVSLGSQHKRGASYAGGSLGRTTGLDVLTANGNAGGRDREPSPTLPTLPSHPTLNALISSGLNDLTPPGSVDATSYIASATAEMQASPPKVPGDPGRRMVGHALGIRHPGLLAKSDALKEGMGGLAIMAE